MGGSGWQEYDQTFQRQVAIYHGTPCTLVYRRPQFLVVGELDGWHISWINDDK